MVFCPPMVLALPHVPYIATPGVVRLVAEPYVRSDDQICDCRCGSCKKQMPTLLGRAAHMMASTILIAGTSVISIRNARYRRQKLTQLAAMPLSSTSSDSFRVVRVEGKGLGAIAVRKIICGELVLRDPPLITFKDNDASWLASATMQFDQLIEAKQLEVMSLADAREPKTLAGIIITNNYSLGLGAIYGGIFLELSRFNHSCVPNCEESWNGDAQEMQVYATTTIEVGEEMCTYFVDPREPRQHRQQKLRDIYGFNCNCPACSNEDLMSERRRVRLLKIGGDIKASGARNPERGIALIVELLGIYDQEAITPKSFWKEACYHAFQLSLLSGDMPAAKRWVEKAHNWSILCHGPEHAMTQQLLRSVQIPEEHRVNLTWDT